MPLKEFAVWCLAYFIGFVWIITVREMHLHLFLELNLTLWICCATLIIAHDAIIELRKSSKVKLGDLL